MVPFADITARLTNGSVCRYNGNAGMSEPFPELLSMGEIRHKHVARVSRILLRYQAKIPEKACVLHML